MIHVLLCGCYLLAVYGLSGVFLVSTVAGSVLTWFLSSSELESCHFFSLLPRPPSLGVFIVPPFSAHYRVPVISEGFSFFSVCHKTDRHRCSTAQARTDQAAIQGILDQMNSRFFCSVAHPMCVYYQKIIVPMERHVGLLSLGDNWWRGNVP